MNVEDPLLGRFFRWAAEGTVASYFAFDTVVLFHKDISKETLLMRFQDFLQMCSSLYLSFLAGHGLKLRGVVGLTEDFLIDDGLLLIKEIDRAFELEKVQQWSGIIVDIPSLESLNWGSGTRAEDEILFYNVPTKSGVEERPVLNPVNKRNVAFLRRNGWSLLRTIETLRVEAASPTVDESAREKLRNTCSFLEYATHNYEGGLKWEQLFEGSAVGPEVP